MHTVDTVFKLLELAQTLGDKFIRVLYLVSACPQFFQVQELKIKETVQLIFMLKHLKVNISANFHVTFCAIKSISTIKKTTNKVE